MNIGIDLEKNLIDNYFIQNCWSILHYLFFSKKKNLKNNILEMKEINQNKNQNLDKNQIIKNHENKLPSKKVKPTLHSEKVLINNIMNVICVY